MSTREAIRERAQRTGEPQKDAGRAESCTGAPPTAATVFLVDGDPAERTRLRRWAAASGLLLRSFRSGRDFLRAYDPDTPGCLLLEGRLPDMSGLELHCELRHRGIDFPTIFLSSRPDIPTVVRAMREGALDFLEKPVDRAILLDRTRQAIEHDHTIRARAVERAERQRRLRALTPRESEVMDLLVAGNANKEIAHTLGLSVRTVEGHRARVMAKLGVGSLTELVRIKLALEPSAHSS